MNVVDDQPAVREVDEQLASLAEAERVYLERRGAQVDGYADAIAEYDAQVNAALLAGKVPPTDRPAEPTPDAEHSQRLVVFESERVRLERRRLAAIASAAPDVTEAVTGLVAETVRKAAPVIDVAEKHLAAITDARRALHAVASAQASLDASNPQRGRREVPTMGEPTLDDLRAAVRGQRDLLAEFTQPRRSLGFVWGRDAENADQDAPEPQTIEPTGAR